MATPEGDFCRDFDNVWQRVGFFFFFFFLGLVGWRRCTQERSYAVIVAPAVLLLLSLTDTHFAAHSTPPPGRPVLARRRGQAP